MKQFTNQQLALLKIKLQNQPEILDIIRSNNRIILNSEILVPEKGIATWNLYYFCPDHNVRLIWNRHSPTMHCCPVDSHVFSGEPYDGAWWRELNGLNSKACNQLGLLWQLTKDSVYLTKVLDILLLYAKYYPDYEEHGGIPYNGPGKANIQTLCEANCLLDFALGYDFISDSITTDQKHYITERLLKVGAQFLIKHRSEQLHNHEVKISSAIGVIGYLLNENSYLEFAVNSPYGLRYQLEYGLLNEGLWFEGSIHYHYYALQGFWAFEKLARGSKYSLLDLPFYQKMLTFPLELLLPNGCFPKLNDCFAGQDKLHQNDIYEFAYTVYGDQRYAAALQFIYKEQRRCNIDSFLFGALELPNVPSVIPTKSIHAPNSGITIFRDVNKKRAFLIKHAPFGGEHDHYDRLDIILFNNNKEIIPDLGTTGYGAKMHYNYYKNSATHNTININQKNQPPQIPIVQKYENNRQFSWLDCIVNWNNNFPKLNSYTMVAWDEKSYKDIIYRRRFLCIEDIIIDISNISNPHQQQLYWTLHIDTEINSNIGSKISNIELLGPLNKLKNITEKSINGTLKIGVTDIDGPNCIWLCAENSMLYLGEDSANPSVKNIPYLLINNSNIQSQIISIYDFNRINFIKSISLTHQTNSSILTLIFEEKSMIITIHDCEKILPTIQI